MYMSEEPIKDKRKNKKKKNYTKYITIRLSEKFLDEVKYFSDICSVSVAEFARDALKEKIFLEKISGTEFEKIRQDNLSDEE